MDAQEGFTLPEIEKLILTAIVALLPPILAWLSKRSKVKSREHQIGKLSTELEFLERITNLSKENAIADQTVLKTSATLVHQNLNRILEEFKLFSEAEEEEQNDPSKLPLLRSALLLFRPKGFKGWLIHLVFWYFMLGVIGLRGPLFSLTKKGEWA